MLGNKCMIFVFSYLIHHVTGQNLLASSFEVITGCYGITHFDFIVPTCTGQTIIAIRGVFLGVKRTSTGCPEIASDSNRDEANCCTVSNEDCKIPLPVSGAGSPYYSNCTGAFRCNMRTTWDLVGSACNDVGYLTRSNYMIIEYYCVKRSETLDGVMPGPVSGQAVYLKNNNYPSMITAGSGATCSISASCITEITVTAIHVDLADTSGTCQQTMTITDGGNNIVISCIHNNNFVIKPLFISEKHFLKAEFVNGRSLDGGFYWLEFRAFNPAATLEMRCGASSLTSAPTVAVCPSPVVSTYSPFTSTITTANNMAGTTVSPNSQESLAPEIVGLIIGLVVLGVSVMALGGFVLYLYKQMLRRNRVAAASQKGGSVEIRRIGWAQTNA